MAIKARSIMNGKVYDGLKDYTFFAQEKDLDKSCKKHLSAANSSGSLETELEVASETAKVDGRAIICRCMNGTRYSVTLRTTGSVSGRRTPYPTLSSTSQFPQSKWVPNNNNESGRYLTTIDDIVDMIRKVLPALDHGTEGLIVVTGATASCKSEVARGIAYRYLQSIWEKERKPVSSIQKRNPHLVTFEDPIERLFCDNLENAHEEGIDYTPRRKGTDGKSLSIALKDALRQTLALFFVGETRGDDDWREVARFAGTGHLIITTAHAGSLVEAMARILRAERAGSPAERGRIAERIRAIVHLRNFAAAPGKGARSDQSAVIPTVWKNTPGGVASLVADGLSSILPSNPLTDRTESVSSIGRYWFANKLLARHKEKDHADWIKQKCLENDVIGI